MNLAETDARVSAQSSKLSRRASIVPEDRNTRAPQLEVNASLSTARRGTGGAENLLRTLGIVEKTGNEFVDYLQAEHAQREQTAMEQGALDQLTGTVDPEKERRSLGYRNAVTKGRTVTNYSDALREFEPELRGLIEDQDSPDLATRQAEAGDRIERFFHDFTIDPETGELKDFMRSPGAMRYLAEEIGRTRMALRASAMQRIEERFNGEAVGHYSKAVIDQETMTRTIDLSVLNSMLPDTVSDEVRNDAFVKALPQGARALWEQHKSVEGIRILDAILGKPATLPRSFGSPSEAGPAVPTDTPTASTGRASFDTLASAVEWRESRGNPNAVSPKGARGSMQTMPGTLRDPGYGVRPAKDGSHAEMKRVGRDYLKAMLKEFGGDYVLALAAYNAGPGNVKEWGLKGTTAQKIAAIPFKETRDYVKAVMARAGVSKDGPGGSFADPSDPVQATPGFRLGAPDADPVTAYEQSGDVPELAGIEAMNLSVDDRRYLQEQRDRLAERIRAEWSQHAAEEQERSSSAMALRLYGQGDPLTSVEITQAIRGQHITPQQGVSLFNLMRQNANAAEAYQDRMEARADRAEAKAREEQAAEISGRYISGILTGRMSGAQARSRLLSELPRITDPVVQASVANTVLGTSGDIEQLITNSEPVRNTVMEFEDQRDLWDQAFSSAGLRGSKLATAQGTAGVLLNRAQAEFVELVRNNVDPQEAKRRVAAKYQPKLQALLPQHRHPR